MQHPEEESSEKNAFRHGVSDNACQPLRGGESKAGTGVKPERRSVEDQPSAQGRRIGAATVVQPMLVLWWRPQPFRRYADGFSDENTLLINSSSTYGAVSIPTGANASVTGILVNVLATAAFDPFTATYDIRQGVSEGNGGTEVSSGSGAVAVAATGRNAFGYQEYTVTVTFSSVTLVPGEYWFNVTPQCTNTLDGSCTVFRQFSSNTTQETNAVNGAWQPDNEIFWNSVYFGETWANWCDSSIGLNTQQCDWLSFGLVGAN